MGDEGSNPDEDEEGRVGPFKVSEGSPESSPEDVDTQEASKGESPIDPYGPPDTGDVTLDESAVKEFFQKKGAVEILSLLADGPKRFREIERNVVASYGTISTRLTQGARLKLWQEYFRYPDEDSGKIKLYSLRPQAEELAQLAEEHDIRESTKRHHEIAQQHTDAVESFRENLPLDDSDT